MIRAARRSPVSGPGQQPLSSVLFFFFFSELSPVILFSRRTPPENYGNHLTTAGPSRLLTSGHLLTIVELRAFGFGKKGSCAQSFFTSSLSSFFFFWTPPSLLIFFFSFKAYFSPFSRVVRRPTSAGEDEVLSWESFFVHSYCF